MTGHTQQLTILSYRLGMALLDGEGISQDEPAGQKMLVSAAEGGHLAAQIQVGLNLKAGRGTAANDDEAFKWFRMAAERHDAGAQFEVGQMLCNGTGVRKNEREGLPWLLKSASQKHSIAQWTVATMYKTGTNAPKDQTKASSWFKKLAEAGHHDAQIELASMAPDTYKQITRRLAFKGPAIANTLGSPARFEGRVAEQGDGWWKVAVTPRRSIVVANARIADGQVRPGVYVVIYGIVGTNPEVEGILHEVPEPSYKWTYRVEAPNGAAGGKTTTYYVRGTVTNTGLQTIKTLVLHVRASQQQSPNNETKDISIHELVPGERRNFSVGFSFYNFQHIGRTSVPTARVSGTLKAW